MGKNLAYHLIIGLAFLVAITLWILSITIPAFSWFNLNWALLIAGGTSGLVFMVRGITAKGGNKVKRLFIMFGAGMLVLALLALVWEFALSERLIAPIISFVFVFALIVGLIAVGGRRWDMGDNQRAGYKNFHQRQAEKEAARLAEQDNQEAISIATERERLEVAAARFEAAAEKLTAQANEAERLAAEAREKADS